MKKIRVSCSLALVALTLCATHVIAGNGFQSSGSSGNSSRDSKTSSPAPARQAAPTYKAQAPSTTKTTQASPPPSSKGSGFASSGSRASEKQQKTASAFSAPSAKTNLSTSHGATAQVFARESQKAAAVAAFNSASEDIVARRSQPKPESNPEAKHEPAKVQPNPQKYGAPETRYAQNNSVYPPSVSATPSVKAPVTTATAPAPTYVPRERTVVVERNNGSNDFLNGVLIGQAMNNNQHNRAVNNGTIGAGTVNTSPQNTHTEVGESEGFPFLKIFFFLIILCGLALVAYKYFEYTDARRGYVDAKNKAVSPTPNHTL